MPNDDVLQPPSSVEVPDRRVVLYDHEDRPMVRMIGFRAGREGVGRPAKPTKDTGQAHG